MRYLYTRFSTLVFGILFLFNQLSAQQINKCATDEKVISKLLQDPAAVENYLRFAYSIKENNGTGSRGGSERVIPVVFHIIHQGGSENISKEQIEDQIRVLNEDFTRTNADTGNTRAIFKPVAANPNIIFRLAQKDPQGNCTEGITRTFSSLTTNAGDNVKSLVWWDNTKYLNIWVVKTIESDGGQGITLGFSSLPGFGGGANDGIVVRSDVVGTIGNISTQLGGSGRTLTHEIGHYLGLLHPFQGGCNPTFFGETVADTPPVAEASFGCDTTANTCTNDNPDLPDMIENYMDYANDECTNLFTLGQKDIMDEILSGTRSNLVSTANLIATGTDGSAAVPCAPVADFYATNTMSCVGDLVNFEDASYNGTVDSYTWSFPTGNPTTSANSSPNVQFSTPGFHNISLSVSNSQGNSSKTKNDYIYVSSETASVSNWQLFEGFESDNSNGEWTIFNVDNIGNTWQQVSNVSYSGSKCMKMNNASGNIAGAVDNFILRSIDLTAINSPTFKFKLANAQKPGGSFSSESNDKLRVLVSTNCGKTWQQRYSKSGSNLSTAGTMSAAFTPTSQSQWREETVSLASFASQQNVLIRFEAISDEGNNIYIDDINISSPVGIDEINENNLALEVYPNPSEEIVFVSFNLDTDEEIVLSLNDITGKAVRTYLGSKLNKGAHSIVINKNELNASGIYFLNLQTSTTKIVRKILFF